VDGGGGGYIGVEILEPPPWVLNASVDINEEGDDNSKGSVERGVDVLDVVEATVMAGRNLPSGPLL
jgi:hypothetical protein